MSACVPTVSQRAEIRVGFRCNARCGFCYYQDSLDNPVEKEPSSRQLFAQLDDLRRSGATEIEFTGGEPTIRPDLPQLIAHAVSLGFVNISIISNGLKLAKAEYAETLVAAGANDFLFSVHGHTAELHDAHTRVRGSFRRIMTAIANVQTLGARCRSSTTVTGRNCAYMPQIVGHLAAAGVDSMHLAVFSPVTEAKGTDTAMSVRYPAAAEAIKTAIDLHAATLPPLSVKYIPFCFMVGYEKYVMNLYQQSFDPDDWNYYLGNKVRRAGTPLKRALFHVAVLAGALLVKDRATTRLYGREGRLAMGFTRLVELLRKKRLPACRDCRYRVVCEFAWRDYVRRFGTHEFVPVRGERVVDPAWCYELARYRTPGVRLASKVARTPERRRAVAE
jgi:pyruvate-formate lyase-activating enzyme